MLGPGTKHFFIQNLDSRRVLVGTTGTKGAEILNAQDKCPIMNNIMMAKTHLESRSCLQAILRFRMCLAYHIGWVRSARFQELTHGGLRRPAAVAMAGALAFAFAARVG